ncbi:hypothetical protein RN22_14240 [Grimontia sp. AD028]|nr:hypothetical protein RN22_14240 [Grimontia sp. AD028]
MRWAGFYAPFLSILNFVFVSITFDALYKTFFISLGCYLFASNISFMARLLLKGIPDTQKELLQ